MGKIRIARWSTTLKLFVATFTLLALLWLLYDLQFLWQPLIISAILAYLLGLPVDFLHDRLKLNRDFSILLVFAALLAVIAAIPVIAAPYAARGIAEIHVDVNDIARALDEASRRVIVIYGIRVDLHQLYLQSLQDFNNWVSRTYLPSTWNKTFSLFASGALVIVSNTVSFLFWFVVILVTTFYMIRDAYKLRDRLIPYLPPDYKDEILYLMKELALIWEAFFRGRLLVALIIGVLVWLSMTILGIRNPPLLGLTAAVVGFVPTVGPVLSSVPSLILALLLGSSIWHISNLWLAVAVAVAYIIIFQLESWVLIPVIVGARVRLHPAIVILGAIAGAELGGVVGIFLAAPVIASLRLVFEYIYRRLLDIEPPVPIIAEEIEPEYLKKPPTLVPDLLQAVLFDLDGTLVETDDSVIDSLEKSFKWMERIPGTSMKVRPMMRSLIMGLEGPANKTITTLNKLHLAKPAFSAERGVRRLLGYKAPPEFEPVAGVIPMLRCLSQRYYVGLVTTRSREEVLAFLAQYNLEHVFSVLVTRESVEHFKPSPEPILKALEWLDVPPEKAIFVGDTSVDILSAKAANVFAVGVLCGFGDEEDMRDADLVLHSTSDLQEILCRTKPASQES